MPSFTGESWWVDHLSQGGSGEGKVRAANDAAAAKGSSVTRPPTASELLANPRVRNLLDSILPDTIDLGNLSENGGWGYMNPDTGEMTTKPAASQKGLGIDLRHPPEVSGSYVIFSYHDHPGPSWLDYDPWPSSNDVNFAWLTGTPALVVSDGGIGEPNRYWSAGPACRWNGFQGPAGYPMPMASLPGMNIWLDLMWRVP